jgi:two-component sensor histidine kinase
MTVRTPLPISYPDVLLHELNHRVANEFSAAISAVSLVASRSSNEEVKRALRMVENLLCSYADVHRALQMPQGEVFVNAALYLRRLCASISQCKLEFGKVRLVLMVQPFRLRADQCWCLGMVVHELITNAVRHAFADGSGEVRVELATVGALVKCCVLDDGSAPANVQPHHGLRIVRELARGLKGRFEQRFGPRGSRSMLIFPRDRDPEIIDQPEIATNEAVGDMP